MKKLLLIAMLMVCGISSAQRTFNHMVWRDANGNVKKETEAYLRVSQIDDNNYITTTTNDTTTKYYAYSYVQGITEVGQGYVSFRIRNIATGEKFLLQIFDDRSLGIRIIDENRETITLYDN